MPAPPPTSSPLSWVTGFHGRGTDALTGHFTELVYQPMLEVLKLLEDKGFQTFIVSGGGIEFVRPWAEPVYGLPPERVIGSSIVTEFQMRTASPSWCGCRGVDFIDDKAGKPVAIQKFIGRRPIAAFGNSDGDLQMLQWATSGGGRRLGVIVRHDDDEREYGYDRDSHVGRLDQALDAAGPAGWLVVSMRRDWGACSHGRRHGDPAGRRHPGCRASGLTGTRSPVPSRSRSEAHRPGHSKFCLE